MSQKQVEVVLPLEVLRRLLRDRSLVVSEFKCQNLNANKAVRSALKSSVMPPGDR